ncbi:MAG: methionyl-tRNA formyltransferase [Flavobacteriaceae bacterium]|nr:methionyl-tRNA formyltransferase [Flavobacteriaceae bacterium]
MGTPDFAVTILDKLVENDYHIVGVITAPDKPAGRGRKLRASAVKNYAVEKGLHLMQPAKLRDEAFLRELESLKPDLQIVVAFRMLPKVVWNLPKMGTFNLHASLLPDYRGAAPIHWAIINGESKTGVTTFFIDDKIDTGEIIASKELDIEQDETVGSLHDKLMYLGADLVCETVDMISANEVQTTKQPTAIDKLAPKLTPENTKIDWEQPLDHIYNKVRGLNPFPASWTSILNNNESTTAKIYQVDKEFCQHHHPVGKIVVEHRKLKVAVKDGFLIIDEIKLSGKRKMPVRDLLNGYSFSEDSKMF